MLRYFFFLSSEEDVTKKLYTIPYKNMGHYFSLCRPKKLQKVKNSPQAVKQKTVKEDSPRYSFSAFLKLLYQVFFTLFCYVLQKRLRKRFP